MNNIRLKDISIEDFCEKYHACEDGKEWARSLRLETMAELWQRKDLRPEWRVWIFSRPGAATEKDQRLFAVWCARQVQHLLTDERSIRAIDVAERFANSQATLEELKAAWEAAVDAAGAAAGAAARAAARDAARDAAWDAAWAAARDAAWAAAWAAARAAARDAARDAAWAAAAAEAAARDAARDAAWAAAWAAQCAELLRRFPCLFEN